MGKERCTLIGPWRYLKGSTRYWNYLEVYWPCAGRLSAVNAIDTQLRDLIKFWTDPMRVRGTVDVPVYRTPVYRFALFTGAFFRATPSPRFTGGMPVYRGGIRYTGTDPMKVRGTSRCPGLPASSLPVCPVYRCFFSCHPVTPVYRWYAGIPGTDPMKVRGIDKWTLLRRAGGIS